MNNKEENKPEQCYWCCNAEFGKHEQTCKNYTPENIDNATCKQKTMDKNSVMKMIIEVARLSHLLCDSAEECENGYRKVDNEEFLKLCDALDSLDELPEISNTICGTGVAKAEHILFGNKND